jgi:hypothetical protein
MAAEEDSDWLKFIELGQVGVPYIAPKNHIQELASTRSLDESGRFQLFQMMGDRGCTDWECGTEIGTGCAVLGRYPMEYLIAAWIGQYARDGANFTSRERGPLN